MADEENWVPITELPFSKRTAERLAKAGLLRVKRVELRDMASRLALQRDGLRKAQARACVMQEEIDAILAALRSRE